MPLIAFAADLLFVDGIDVLLSRGAVPDARVEARHGKRLEDIQGHTALFRLASLDASNLQFSRVVTCAKRLIQAGASVDAPCWALDAQALRDSTDDYDTLKYGWFSVRDRHTHMETAKRNAWANLIELADAMTRSAALDESLPVASSGSAPRARF